MVQAPTVGDLVAERPARARVFEALGIDYCCGGRQPLAAACSERGLELTAVAALLDAVESTPGRSARDMSLTELCDHIVSVHHAFLRRELPRLSTLLEKCARAHGAARPELDDVRATYERLRLELEQHLAEEERSLFPACRRLEEGEGPDAGLLASLEHLEVEHELAGSLLRRLSDLTNGYDTGSALCNTHRAALDALAELERDMHEHVHEENAVLFPRALAVAER